MWHGGEGKMGVSEGEHPQGWLCRGVRVKECTFWVLVC